MAAGDLPASARRNEIVDAAAAAFYDAGYDATSMQDIADRVGLLKGSLYHHIRSKEDLLAAVLADAQDGGLEIVRRHQQHAQASCTVRLRAFVMDYTVYCLDGRVKAAIFDREFRYLPPRLKRQLLSTRDEFDRFLRQLLRDGVQAGEFSRDIDVVVMTNVIYSLMNTVYRWYSPKGPASAGVVSEHIADLVGRGLNAGSIVK